MTAPVQSVESPKFKAPTTDTWRNLAADAQADTPQQDAAKEARDSLKETLVTSLQMQHVIVLAGAGTSMAVGGPSMKDLWDAAIGTNPSTAAVSTAKSIRYNLNSQNNIEEWF